MPRVTTIWHDRHHAQALEGRSVRTACQGVPGNPYDGHTLATVIPDMEKTIGSEIERLFADAGYKGHNAPLSHKFKVLTSGQKRRVTPAIKRETKRRAAIEPVIGHIKNEHPQGSQLSPFVTRVLPGSKRATDSFMA
jgi:transposase, IS5 family